MCIVLLAITSLFHKLIKRVCNLINVFCCFQDINDFEAVNEVYKTFFSSVEPARVAYQAGSLPKEALVEIEAVAILGDIVDSKLNTNHVE